MDASDLYGLPLDQFIPERSALAKSLRAAGERDEAARVAKLAKPSVAAWAVNQLVRTQHEAIAALFEAGDGLQHAHAELMAGQGSARTLREAGEQERAAVAALLDAAGGLLTSEGHALTPPMLDRVADSLHAAAQDGTARDAVKDGCLVRELTRAGLGEGVFAAGPPSQPRPKKEAKAAKAAEAAAKQEARRRAEQATRELQAALERRDLAAAALKQAEDELRLARERAAELARDL